MIWQSGSATCQCFVSITHIIHRWQRIYRSVCPTVLFPPTPRVIIPLIIDFSQCLRYFSLHVLTVFLMKKVDTPELVANQIAERCSCIWDGCDMMTCGGWWEFNRFRNEVSHICLNDFPLCWFIVSTVIPLRPLPFSPTSPRYSPSSPSFRLQPPLLWVLDVCTVKPLLTHTFWLLQNSNLHQNWPLIPHILS